MPHVYAAHLWAKTWQRPSASLRQPVEVRQYYDVPSKPSPVDMFLPSSPRFHCGPRRPRFCASYSCVRACVVPPVDRFKCLIIDRLPITHRHGATSDDCDSSQPVGASSQTEMTHLIMFPPPRVLFQGGRGATSASQPCQQDIIWLCNIAARQIESSKSACKGGTGSGGSGGGGGGGGM